MISILKITKGHHSVKTVFGITVLILCTQPDMFDIAIEFHLYIFHGIKFIEWT